VLLAAEMLAAEVPLVLVVVAVKAIGINTLVFRNTLGNPLNNGTLSRFIHNLA
jgi:hypothetical protein